MSARRNMAEMGNFNSIEPRVLSPETAASQLHKLRISSLECPGSEQNPQSQPSYEAVAATSQKNVCKCQQTSNNSIQPISVIYHTRDYYHDYDHDYKPRLGHNSGSPKNNPLYQITPPPVEAPATNPAIIAHETFIKHEITLIDTNLSLEDRLVELVKQAELTRRSAETDDAPPPSSPLSSMGTPPPDVNFPHTSPSPKTRTTPDTSRRASSVLTDLAVDFPIDHDYDGPEGHPILRLKPTVTQWDDFPAILDFARSQGAENDGCFKIILPHELQDPLPEKVSQKALANAYKPKQIKKNRFWRVNTVPSEGTFASSVLGPVCDSSAFQAVEQLKKMFHKHNDRQIRHVRYRVDVPAWTPDQRLEAGVPERSPIHPLKGDKLDETRAIIPGIHTPYVYESGPHFGASFQIHAEDFRLVSLNHLYKGRKIWIVVPSTAVGVAEGILGRQEKCSQFMRHRAEFFFPQKLESMGIPFRIIDQRPGETMVILPDAYHEGFSTGYTIAEAKNYADANWSTDTYQPCEASCQLVTAIPADLMRPLRDGEARLDLCAPYGEAVPSPKKRVKVNDQERRESKRIKLRAGAPGVEI
ncbi:hypothetical protein G7046_g2314 [Stylonectria norvegica]|nr:hypothetical protein G7046_g2314 [Stylonectria norvegica]